MQILPFILNIAIFHSVSAILYYPDPTTYFLEHLLVDAHGVFRSGFADAITPCSNYASGSQIVGRSTSAQWIRNAFHDFITADIAAGTGGIDSSISFETGRPENAGSSFNDSLAFFAERFSSYVSMSDLIALSVVMSFGNCGGTQLQAKGGRIDATEAGPSGTPGPGTSIEQTLSEFLGAGMNQADAIALTACGHSIGAVHYDAEPTIVNPSYVSDNNTSGAAGFDGTPMTFDNNVVQDYISGTGTMGGQLVTTALDIAKSDMRLYSSDDNATVAELANGSSAAFVANCGSLFQRMIDTVPSNVVLTDVSPQPIKPVNTTVSLNQNGTMIFSGSIRVLLGDEPPSMTCLSIEDVTDPTNCINPLTLAGNGSSIYGSTWFYPFSIPILNPSALSGFHVEVTTPGQLQAQMFSIQTKAFFTGARGAWTNDPNKIEGLTFQVATISKDTSISVTLENTVPQTGSLSPTIKRYNLSISEPESSFGNYTLRDASYTIEGNSPIKNAVLTLLMDGVVADTLFIPK